MRRILGNKQRKDKWIKYLDEIREMDSRMKER